jgi:hypothetical protein
MNISKLIMKGEFSPEMLRYCFHSGNSGQQRKQATTDFGQQGNLTNAAQGTDAQFEGPVQNSPFYKSLLTTGIQNTSNAYQTAQSNMKAKANSAGFGQNQPVAQGADNQVEAQETSALAQVPNEAEIAAAPLSLEAAGQTGNMGMGYGNQGVNLLNANANKPPLWQTLLGMGTNAGLGAAQVASMY